MSTQSMRMPRPNTVPAGVLVCIVGLIALVAFSGGLLNLVERWSRQEEYSHGFLIPFVAAWLLWSRRDAVAASVGEPSWTGPVIILAAVIMLIVGEMSAFFLLMHVGLVLALLGVVLSVGGISLFKVTFIPIAF